MKSNVSSFNTKSDEYALARPRYTQEFYNFLLSQLKEKDKLWDCACGNGQVAIDLINDFKQVYGTDVSENQIKNAFHRQRIEYSVSESEKTSFPNDFFDMICVAQAMHWFDLEKFFAETNRVLKKDGILAVFGYGFFKINAEIDMIINEKLHFVIDEFWSEGNRIVISRFKGIKFPFNEIKTPHFEMNQHWNFETLLAYLNTWSAVKRYNTANNTDIINQLQSHLLPYWKSNEEKTVKMELYNFIRQK